MPARSPATVAAIRASHTGTPFTISIAQTIAPVQIEPSTVRSAISNILNVMYTPIAIMPQISPWATAPGKAERRPILFSFLCPKNY